MLISGILCAVFGVLLLVGVKILSDYQGTLLQLHNFSCAPIITVMVVVGILALVLGCLLIVYWGFDNED